MFPFFRSKASVRAAIQAIRQQGDFLPSIFPYRGEAWGTWSQVTYLNQRHFASAIGILLLVLVFLVIRYRAAAAKRAKARSPAPGPSRSQTNRLTEVCADYRLTEDTPENVSKPRGDFAFERGRRQITKTGSKSLLPAGESVDTESMPVTVNPAATEAVQNHKQDTCRGSRRTDWNQITRSRFCATLPPFYFLRRAAWSAADVEQRRVYCAAAVLGVLFLLFPLRRQMLALGGPTQA